MELSLPAIQEAGTKAIRGLTPKSVLGAGVIAAVVAALVDATIELYNDSVNADE